MNNQNTYWVESDCDGIFLFCENPCGGVGKCNISPLEDPDWGFAQAWPDKYIIECAVEAESESY